MCTIKSKKEKIYRDLPSSLLHVLDPNSPSFYVICPTKYQKINNFDIFPTLSQIYTSPPVVMYYTPGHFCKIDTGGVVHHYSYLSVPYFGTI